MWYPVDVIYIWLGYSCGTQIIIIIVYFEIIYDNITIVVISRLCGLLGLLFI
jgi:hypothetical protein